LRPPGSLVSLPFSIPIFAAAWVGGAGLDRPADLVSVRSRLAQILSLTDISTLLVTNDAALLSSAIVDRNDDNPTFSKTGVVLVVGTGSIAYSFSVTSAERKLVSVPLERTGGWGYLLGDEGSAYSIGREAIRRALCHRDTGATPTKLHKIVADYFGCNTIGAIISAVYTPNQFQEKVGVRKPMAPDPKLRIASLAPFIFRAAFPADSDTPDQEALAIIRQAATTTVDIIEPLLRDKSQILAQKSTLAMGGALAQISEFRDLVVSELGARGQTFAHVEAVADAAGCAVNLLVRDFLL
jgi:N-acetylmuramic acid 6-phosphate etherase